MNAKEILFEDGNNLEDVMQAIVEWIQSISNEAGAVSQLMRSQSSSMIPPVSDDCR